MDQTVVSDRLTIKNCCLKWLSITSFKYAREEEKYTCLQFYAGGDQQNAKIKIGVRTK